MCFQFDVYRNPSDRTREYQPYFMIIQQDYYEDLSTRFIVPLSYHNHLRGYLNAATPLVNSAAPPDNADGARFTSTLPNSLFALQDAQRPGTSADGVFAPSGGSPSLQSCL
ncbi:CcdB family protein [Enterobacter hormaechei]|uniref:Toxin CcdB n=2 Tax=Enterobacter hormaechei TaxID=158836 RepID=A0ABD4JXZ0_9ENTR|nr:CcdB family protein [Enterobacter hormaechei]UAS92621.1 CcdB family protein [Enterobacter cloacae complex sp.]HCM9494952.1 CcdB family protein [Enterobacter hormaechei subsp. hormaechei]EJB6971859.1 CcdB family protein [Enterobacter hormaechei]EKT5040401.1 CcdB family protein [Enterobacter hormaechei]EKV4058510.1 CcdB family protein [Enterobacter hormaechei]